MARLAVVLSIVGLMSADPILCRAEVRALPCSGTCQVWHQASASHPEPAAPGHDSAHGCLCQGATRNSGEEFAFVSEAGALGLSPLPRGIKPAHLWAGINRGWREVVLSRARRRSVRIEIQSFLT